jgi:hypothetical protein
MTEAEWLACRDPDVMLEFLYGEASGRHQSQPSRRKVRLFACACCRRAWSSIPDERSRRAVEVAERYADRRATRRDLALAFLAAKAVNQNGNAGFAAMAAAALSGSPARAAVQAALAGDVRRWDAERAAQATLVRDIFGNPFHPLPVLDPEWLAWDGGAIAQFARAIYEEAAFDHLPVLADALEKAGCTNADILGHLHRPGPHVRGCCLVDALLAKN